VDLVGRRDPQAARGQRTRVLDVLALTIRPRPLRCFPRVGAILDDRRDRISEARSDFLEPARPPWSSAASWSSAAMASSSLPPSSNTIDATPMRCPR
jgi:hypothetical protein